MLPRRIVPVALLTAVLTVLALTVPVALATPAPAPSAHPKLTTNTSAPCNTRPKTKGHAQCFAVVRTPANKTITPDADGPPATALGPADIQDAYKLPVDQGNGQTVAIVDAYGDSHAEDDLAAFRSQYGLAPCTSGNGCFQKVDQTGGTNYPPDDSGWGLETSLDLDAVSAACPNCHILLVQANDNSTDALMIAEDTAVSLGAKYVSNSWGGTEGSIGDPGGLDKHFDHPGVAIVVSSGDTGNVVNWPSSIPTVTSAGGTYLSKDTSTTRGWTETVWAGGGSGCSSVELKPDYQGANGLDTHCDKRATADISADADPASGLAIYDTLGETGWLQVGGTSLSSPLLAATYALAGTPAPDTYPVTYPYDPTKGSGLFDITDGTNGTCGNLLCQAGPGWDGPTGMGTPNGATALSGGPHGELAGQVTDAGTGDPITGATVSTPQGYTDTTDAEGDYDLNVLTGSYDISAAAYGYGDKSQSGVQVTEGQTATVNFALTKAAMGTLSGTVTDGSGHGWPLYTKITIDGYPKGAIYTDPYTGHYTVDLPQQHSYTLHVTSVYPGYQPKDLTVPLNSAAVEQDPALGVDTSTCDAPGYVSQGNCAPTPGGLVAGVVTDASTSDPVNGAKVVSDAKPNESGTSSATDDPTVPGGFYWLFSSSLGSTQFTASRTAYQAATAPVDVAADTVVREDWALNAGRLSVSPADLSATETLGQSTTRKVSFTNSGATPLHVDLGTQDGGAASVGQASTARPTPATSQTPRRSPNATASKWDKIADYPFRVEGLAAATDPISGKLYAVGGRTNVDTSPKSDGQHDWITDKGYVYDSSQDAWTPIANAPRQFVGASAAFLDGTLYVAGGVTPTRGGGAGDIASAAVYAYHPGADSWSMIASLPHALAQAGVAVLNGQLYVVGGCTGTISYGGCIYGQPAVDSVYRFDPRTNGWTQLANYPTTVTAEACAGLDGKLVCAGGKSSGGESALDDTYIYDPATNRWSKGADLPARTDSMAYSAANGKLQIASGGPGGEDGSTAAMSKAWQYDPATNAWTALPDVNTPHYRSGSSCGFFKVGGTNGPSAYADAEVLPGYDRCDGAGDLPWLSASRSGFDLQPGQSVTVTVTLDSAQLDQPGSYSATLYAEANTPYPVQTIDVTLHVSSPKGWSLLDGTVTDSGGHPLGWATITDPGSQSTFAVTTNAAGRYQWWLNAKSSPLQISAARDGYQPQATRATPTAGKTTTVNFTLKEDPESPAYHPAASRSGAASTATRTPTNTSPTNTTPASKSPLAKNGPPWEHVCAEPTKPGLAACLALRRTDLPGHRGLLPQATPAGYGPADLQEAYNLPSTTAGVEQAVAIVDAFDDPSAEADLQTYRAQYGLPACTTANGCFKKVNQDGQQGPYPGGDQGWATEISLDIDMVSAACPNCHILLVEADDNQDSNLGAAVNTAVALGAKYVSNSYGAINADGSEVDGTTNDHYFDHPGVAITVSAGDNGYGVEWPASSPTVTSVGGTSLTRDTSTTRGWTETVWGNGSSGTHGDGTGSGCSQYETAKPIWQHDTGCAHRTTADVSAVADPATGVAVYDSYGQSGWLQVGGTSASSPIIASTYALAGAPQPGTSPASYPYLHNGGLNDIIAGTNGTCTPAYLCTGEPGYDGPTGLGTPNGTSAFTPVDAGTVAGTITDASTGKPIADARLSVGELAGKTDGQGRYTMVVAPGSYTVTAHAFGYADKDVTGVQVSQGQTTTQDFALNPAPSVTLSGTVTDGSGHGWPLYAKITIPSTPLKPVYTDPYTGTYSISIPAQASYTLHVEAVSTGYTAKDVTVDVGTTDVPQDLALSVAETTSCRAAGYVGQGVYQGFEWPDVERPIGSTPQDGWTVDTSTDFGWLFANPGSNPVPGGSGGFAGASPYINGGANIDTSLISPAFDLTHVSAPEITFDTTYISNNALTADVDLSLDGGKTWQNVWRQSGAGDIEGAVDVPMPQAAGKSGVKVRFHLVGGGSSLWYIDNVNVDHGCAPTPGGLVAGVVTDANTGGPVDGASVASVAKPSESGTSSSAGDPNMPGAYYSLFSSVTGSTGLTATAAGFTAATAQVNVTADTVAHQDWVLKAGRLAVTPATLSTTQTLGQSTTAKVTLTNDGSAPMRVDLGTQGGAFTPLGSGTGPGGTAARVPAAPTPTGPYPAGGPGWTDIAPYPMKIVHNAVAYDAHTGDVYSVGGSFTVDNVTQDRMTAKAYVYRPATGKWTPIAPAPQPLAYSVAAFVDGTLYVVGGGGAYSTILRTVYAYHPATNTWTQAAGMPEPRWVGQAEAVLDGKLYVIGGCGDTNDCYTPTNTVYRYDPLQDTWTKLADYPTSVLGEACAGIDAKVICAGGLSDSISPWLHQRSATYIYDPMTDTWSQGADMPYDAYYMGYSAANGKLQVFGGQHFGGSGVTAGIRQVLSDAAQYDPATNTWSALPSLPSPAPGAHGLTFVGGSCGLYAVGGEWSVPIPDGEIADITDRAWTLSGYGQCDGQGQPAWLSTQSSVTLNPGQSINLAVTLDSTKVAQPGTYTATLWARPYSPYPVKPVSVTMDVIPPASWGELTGRVTDAGTGDPIVNATVQLCANGNPHRGSCGSAAFTVRTDQSGYYQWWVDMRDNPLQVIAAKDGYLQRVTTARVARGAAVEDTPGHRRQAPGPDSGYGATVVDFALPWHGFV